MALVMASNAPGRTSDARTRPQVDLQTEAPKVMRIQINNPALLDDLAGFLRSRGCVVELVGERELDVFCLSSVRHDHVQMELDLYLQLWRAVHSDTETSIVD
jgi:hypothetical protein